MYDRFFETLEQRQLLSTTLAASSFRAEASTAAIVQTPLHSELHDASLLTTATLRAWPVTTAGATQYAFKVAYSPSYGSRRAISQNQSIVVTGPQGYRELAQLVSMRGSSDVGVTARYSIHPPDGAWSASANGTYAVMLRTGPAGQRTRSPLGTFGVAIDDGTPAPANQPPSFTGGPDQTVTQDSGTTTVANWATDISAGPAGEASQTLTFMTSTDNDALFATKPAIATDGTLTFTPAAGASGAATVTVQLKDGGGTANRSVDTSAAKTFTITVTPTPVVVNAAPSFTAGANQTVAEDSGPKTVANWATNISAGPASEAGQTLTFMTSTNNDALFATKPAVAANGTLTFTPAAGASGVATVAVLLKDNGGTANGGVDTSIAKTFTITVTPAAPTIPSFVGTYNGTLVIPAVGHNRSATLSITNQTTGGAVTGTLVSGNVSLNVTGTVAANGTFTMSMVTPAGTPHAGGAIALTTSGTVVAVGKQMVLALSFTQPAVTSGTLTVTRA